MKRMYALLLSLTLLLCSCASSPEQQPSGTSMQTLPATTASTEPSATTPEIIFEAPLVALSMPVSIVETTAEDGALICSHATQAFSLILPNAEAAQSIMFDFSSRMNSGSNGAKSVHEAALEDYTGQDDWMPYMFSNLYSPARLDQSILSLYGSEVIFDGSAGSASVNLSVTYDLLTGNTVDEITQILVADYSADALCQLIYDQLSDLASQDMLYADYAYTVSDMFSTNVPVKNWYFNNRGLCFYFMPYELAPHSVGTIIAEIPYASLNGLLQDRYFPAETVDFQGQPVLKTFSNTQEYEQIAEITLSENGTQYILRADGTLFDISISYAQNEGALNGSEVTVFSAASLGSGDAVILQCEESELELLTLTYRSDGTYQTVPLLDCVAN